MDSAGVSLPATHVCFAKISGPLEVQQTYANGIIYDILPFLSSTAVWILSDLLKHYNDDCFEVSFTLRAVKMLAITPAQ
jgi:hypothetical protein